MDKDSIKILREINASLKSINSRNETSEMFAETEKLLEKSDCRVEKAIDQIQTAFDRIHDKVFNFNNILIGAYLVLGTFPSNSPTLKLWTIIFPILNLIFMIYIDFRQMEIHRFASKEQEWANVERAAYGVKIRKQTLLSLLSFLLSLISLVYLIVKVL
jgi:hypothetical protein